MTIIATLKPTQNASPGYAYAYAIAKVCFVVRVRPPEVPCGSSCSRVTTRNPSVASSSTGQVATSSASARTSNL
jgi:hypothetical protein